MIQTTEVSITYKGDGVQTLFPYPYPYRNSDDIVGYIINDVGYEKRITNNFKYDKVSNIYQYPLAGDPLAAPYSIKLIRETPQQQNADLPGKLPFLLIEKSLDWIIMILQEIGSRCNSLWHIRNDCKLSETNARNSASAAAESEENIANSENLTKKWAMSSVSPDGVIDTNSPTGYTQSSRSWALYSKEKAQSWAESEGSPDGKDDSLSTTGKTKSAKGWAMQAKEYAGSLNLPFIINAVLPVGSIIEFINDTDPNELYQGTTWVKMDAGRVLISAGTHTEDDTTYTYNLGDKGGEAKHQITIEELVNHSHSMTSNGDHYHLISRNKDISNEWVTGDGADTVGDFNDKNTFKTSTSGNHTHDISSVGGDKPHENRMPYQVINRWKRIA